MFKSTTLFGGLFLAALLLAACGGGGEEPQPTPSPSPAQPSPTAEPTPEPTPTPEPAARQLAYVGADGAIWLVNAGGSERTRFADVCSRQEIYPVILAWSADGDKLAVSCQTPGAAEPSLVVLDEAGRRLAEAEGVSVFRWSPDGRHIAYRQDGAVKLLDIVQGTDLTLPESANVFAWSPDSSSLAYVGNSGEALIYDVAGRQQTSLAGAIDRVMAWVLDGKALLVASNVRDCGITCLEDVSLLDLDSGELTSVSQLDDTTQFWLSPDRTKAAFLSGVAQRPVGGATISILDFATLHVTPVQDATIGFPSESIPSRHLAFSGDGSTIYWADVRLPPTDIYRATTDGGEPTKLASLVNTLDVEFSPDRTQIAYIDVTGNPPILWIANIDGSGSNEIGPIFNASAFAWRSTP